MARYDHQDPALKTGAGGLTVWQLRRMAQDKRFDELNALFNDGLNMNAVPVGYAAGAAARVADVDKGIIADVLDGIAGEAQTKAPCFAIVPIRIGHFLAVRPEPGQVLHVRATDTPPLEKMPAPQAGVLMEQTDDKAGELQKLCAGLV